MLQKLAWHHLICISCITNDTKNLSMPLLRFVFLFLLYSLPIFFLILSFLPSRFIDLFEYEGGFHPRCQPRIFYLAKLSFRSKGEMKTWPDKQKLKEFSQNPKDCPAGNVYVKYQHKEEAGWPMAVPHNCHFNRQAVLAKRVSCHQLPGIILLAMWDGETHPWRYPQLHVSATHLSEHLAAALWAWLQAEVP